MKSNKSCLGEAKIFLKLFFLRTSWLVNNMKIKFFLPTRLVGKVGKKNFKLIILIKFFIINIYAGNIKFTNHKYLDLKNNKLLRKIEFDQY